jgi:serine/threonine protein kinase
MKGVILGTAAYMSPEQARGKSVDKRTDIWAFGCALYELLTGKPVFHREDITDILAAVVRAEPEWTALPANVSPSIRVLLQRCLRKDRRQRISDANVSRLMVEMKTGTHDRGATFFPLYRYESLLGAKPVRVHNPSEQFVSEWCEIRQTHFVSVGRGDLETTSGPGDVFFWLYGLFHSPEYRRRYRAALAQRFPIVLLSCNKRLLRKMTQLGSELVTLHVLESPRLDEHLTTFTCEGRPEGQENIRG